MLTALLIIGLLIALGVPATMLGARIILKLTEPPVGSTAHLKQWLLEDLDRDVPAYLRTFNL